MQCTQKIRRHKTLKAVIRSVSVFCRLRYSVHLFTRSVKLGLALVISHFLSVILDNLQASAAAAAVRRPFPLSRCCMDVGYRRKPMTSLNLHSMLVRQGHLVLFTTAAIVGVGCPDTHKIQVGGLTAHNFGMSCDF